jgi:sulfite exporter TauE/SafE
VDELGVISAFVVGILGGVHCVGMCGGIVGALSLGMPGAGATRWTIQLAYNLGRIASYTLAGALAGGLGYFFSGLLPVQQAQQVLLLVAGVFMILLGLYLAGWWNLLLRVEQAGGWLWKRIEPLGRGLLPVRNARHAVLLGALWGWLPCGLVYSVLIWSVSAGGVWQGASLMLSFGLGTLPNLLAMGVAAATLQRFVRHPGVRQLAGALIIVFGVVQIVTALSLV